MSSGKTYVIGAGLAGLAAATHLAEAGRRVEVCEAAAQAGGRCRSYYDAQLDLMIDNGNHLVLSGNAAVMTYLARIGASDRLAGPPRAEIAFADLRDGKRWTLRPNAGLAPWWIFSAGRRPPGVRARDFLALRGLMHPKRGARIDASMPCSGPLWDKLLRPFFLAALNTAPEESAADLAAALLRETLALGEAACRPRIASPHLAAAFIDPALSFLAQRGANVRLGRRLRELRFNGGRVDALAFAEGVVALDPADQVVLAAPPWIAQSLAPGLPAPDSFHAILNAHFHAIAPAGAHPIVGVIGGVAEWVFAFEDRLSVTISAADALLDEDRDLLAARIWKDVAAVHGLSPETPPYRIVKERRATFAATPDQAAKRPAARTQWANLFLAGDWTDTGLPATLEGAVRSGERAALMALASELV